MSSSKVYVLKIKYLCGYFRIKDETIEIIRNIIFITENSHLDIKTLKYYGIRIETQFKNVFLKNIKKKFTKKKLQNYVVILEIRILI